MKMRFALMIMFMLMLLPSALEAKDVYLALVSEDITKAVTSFDTLDAIIKSNSYDIDHYFQNGDLTLQPNQEFIIRGGRGPIKRELDQYKTRNVILNTYGQDWLTLNAYSCYLKRPIGKDNTTYVMLRSGYKWQGEKYCPKELVLPGATTVVVLGELGAAVRPR
jgi:hypothetical protein